MTFEFNLSLMVILTPAVTYVTMSHILYVMQHSGLRPVRIIILYVDSGIMPSKKWIYLLLTLTNKHTGCVKTHRYNRIKLLNILN